MTPKYHKNEQILNEYFEIKGHLSWVWSENRHSRQLMSKIMPKHILNNSKKTSNLKIMEHRCQFGKLTKKSNIWVYFRSSSSILGLLVLPKIKSSPWKLETFKKRKKKRKVLYRKNAIENTPYTATATATTL